MIQFEAKHLLRLVKIANTVEKIAKDNVIQFKTQGENLYIYGVSADSMVELHVGECADIIHFAVHGKQLEQVLDCFPDVVQIQPHLDETSVLFTDAVQELRLTTLVAPSLSQFTETQVLGDYTDLFPVLKHMYEVTTEQSDVADLQVSLTGHHAVIGNYLYAKRVAYTCPSPLTLNTTNIKLLLVLMGSQQSNAIRFSLVQHFGVYLQAEIGAHRYYTNAYSQVPSAVNEIFLNQGNGDRIQLQARALKAAIDRTKKVVGMQSVQLVISDNQLSVKAQTDLVNSLIHCEFDSTQDIEAVTCDVEMVSLYHLTKNLSLDEPITVVLDREYEAIYMQNAEQEMLLSVFI